jgi:hypothetical protein
MHYVICAVAEVDPALHVGDITIAGSKAGENLAEFGAFSMRSAQRRVCVWSKHGVNRYVEPIGGATPEPRTNPRNTVFHARPCRCGIP